MRAHALHHGVKNIAMPKIGCGLDQLQWPAVRTLIKNIFQHHPITLTVYVMEGVGKATTKSIPVGVDAKRSDKEAKLDKFTEVGFGYRVRRPLADAFVGLRILLPPSVPKYDILRRHIVAFGGVCLKKIDGTPVPTHVIVVTGKQT